jgi:tetratricopeptide (TPR) repeat protein
VCQAVGYAHAHRVIHRDLKPANVMVGAFGEVQVMDWGLAKVLGEESPATAEAVAAEQTRAWTEVSPTPEAGAHTQAGSLVGTPAFIAPEQAVGEIERVKERSDVFGLGALLAVILTGKPPYVGETFESVRVQAVRGKLDDCFARLDASGAEPELLALCKQCLAFEPADRPADAGAVAQAVAGLRAAADERARRAELEQVRVEGERATAQARAAERRKRRRLALLAAAVLGVAAVGGLTAVVVVQRRANAELADEQAKVEARFELAQKAIALFHTGVSEDMLLKNAEFKDLRTKLLKEAAGFYDDLKKLLEGQTDAKSRKALAAAYFELAELTGKIGSRPEALAIHCKALAIRRELAAAPGADVGTRLDVVHSLGKIGVASERMSDYAGALVAYQEGGDLAERLAAEQPTDAVRFVLAQSYDKIGWVLRVTGKPTDALEAHGKVLAIVQELADANPANTEFQFLLVLTHDDRGHALRMTGKSAEALAAHGKALAIARKLADANPADTRFQMYIAGSHNSIGLVLSQQGKPAEALAAQREALAIRQRLVDAHHAVTDFQYDLLWCHDQIGLLLLQTGKLAEALEAHGKALAILQKLADANPANTKGELGLVPSHCYIGRVLARLQRFPEAFTALDAGVALHSKLVESDPDNTSSRTGLACSLAYRGAARARAGQPPLAAADLRRAVELWASGPSGDTVQALGWYSRFELSRALALLAALGKDPKSGVIEDEARTFADQSVAALANAVKTGCALPVELKEPDFDALRGREDFQNLLAELEAKVGPKARPKD